MDLSEFLRDLTEEFGSFGQGELAVCPPIAEDSTVLQFLAKKFGGLGSNVAIVGNGHISDRAGREKVNAAIGAQCGKSVRLLELNEELTEFGGQTGIFVQLLRNGGLRRLRLRGSLLGEGCRCSEKESRKKRKGIARRRCVKRKLRTCAIRFGLRMEIARGERQPCYFQENIDGG